MDKKNGNGNNHWKVSVAEFRGYMRGKLEDIVLVAVDQKKEMNAVKKDIVKIKEYIAGRKAVQNFRSAFWGFIGSMFFLVLGFVLYKVFG